jgi:hypothetical protein
MAGLVGANKAIAQPTSYCNPSQPAGYTSWCYNASYGYIANVRVFNSTTGMNAINNASGADPNCYVNTGVEGNLQLGNSYTIRVTGYNPYMYGGSMYTRAFIDWNADGDFVDAGEYLGTVFSSLPYMTTGTFDVDYNITVTCAIQKGKTRLRVATAQWYDASNKPCINGGDFIPYNYGYGEVEDYILNFDQDLKETFPGQFAILHANEAYDGTDRTKNGSIVNFTRPYVKTYAPQTQGTFLSYKIVGPLPSLNVVYEGLDPVTGSANINMGGMDYCPIQKARGSYANPDGSFKASIGGEYREIVSIFGSGCQAQAVKVFTVAWQNDLSIRDIASPSTNIAPRYFRYPRGNTVRVAGTFQNTGEAKVTNFTANAIIIGTNGRDTVYNETITFDTTEGKAGVLPGQKITLDFPMFRADSAIGIFKMYMHSDLLSAVDQDDYNDYMNLVSRLECVGRVAWP